MEIPPASAVKCKLVAMRMWGESLWCSKNLLKVVVEIHFTFQSLSTELAECAG
jgi:hypothetical protein